MYIDIKSLKCVQLIAGYENGAWTVLPNLVRGARIQDSLKSRRKPVAKAIRKKEVTVSVLCPSNPNMSFYRVTGMINVLGDETTARRWNRETRRDEPTIIDRKEDEPCGSFMPSFSLGRFLLRS